MNQHPKSSSREVKSALALGTAAPTTALGDADGLMSDVIFKLRVNQLVSTLRATEQINGEACTMLTVLESLVVAGEISFNDFMQRVQNLFPHVFDEIDPELRDNLLRMLAD